MPVETRYTYGEDYNQILTVTDPLGNVSSFEYDGLGRLVEASSPREVGDPA